MPKLYRNFIPANISSCGDCNIINRYKAHGIIDRGDGMRIVVFESKRVGWSCTAPGGAARDAIHELLGDTKREFSYLFTCSHTKLGVSECPMNDE